MGFCSNRNRFCSHRLLVKEILEYCRTIFQNFFLSDEFFLVLMDSSLLLLVYGRASAVDKSASMRAEKLEATACGKINKKKALYCLLGLDSTSDRPLGLGV